MALAFAALLGGAVILDYGKKNVSGAFASGTPAAGASAATATATTATTAAGTSTPAADRTSLLSIASLKGWNGAEVSAWQGVIAKEDASYSLTAKNPTSDAIGIAQGITGPSWYAAHGGVYGTVTGELTAMANYIQQRYGTPSAALQHENTMGWY
jgi:hypothetical protein